MKHLSNNGETTVTLHKFEKLDPPSAERSSEDYMVVFLDVETTGLNADTERVIQLCVRPALVNRDTAEFSAIAKSKTYYNDPGFPLSDEIKSLTNISDADVSGETIDWEWVSKTLNQADFVVCHNANFDRAFIEKELNRASFKSTQTIWACSMNQVFWRDFCRPSRALEVLCAWSGFF